MRAGDVSHRLAMTSQGRGSPLPFFAPAGAGMRIAAPNPSVTGACAGDTSPFRGGKAAPARNDIVGAGALDSPYVGHRRGSDRAGGG